jgi:hypothetical protein
MRRNLEAEALRQFAEAAGRMGATVFRGQRGDNRLLLSGNNYFQFGDLRVEMDGHTVVVETESGGGVTNLAKYWYWIRRNAPSKPLTLLHLFQQNSENDYVAHLELWDFLADEMMKDVGEHFSARRFCFRDPADLSPAVREFTRLLESHEVIP